MCAPYVCNAHGDQKKGSYPLGLELQTFVTLPTMWVLGLKPWLPGRAVGTPNFKPSLQPLSLNLLLLLLILESHYVLLF